MKNINIVFSIVLITIVLSFDFMIVWLLSNGVKTSEIPFVVVGCVVTIGLNVVIGYFVKFMNGLE